MVNIPNPKMHNVRFYKPKAKAIYCMALHSQEDKLAVSRSDSRIEIWNLTHCPFIERTIASSTENFSVEGLAWCDSRLFSVGLHGLLIEYDLYKLGIKSRAVVTGEAAFCLDINNEKNEIAIGTEQGYLNIFQITDEEVLFSKFLDKQEGRILCLKYDKSGEFIVSGSMDVIRIWSVKTGQALHKMITGRSEQNKATIVWCLAVTENFTIISGDSRGILTVWDGKMGAQLDSYQSHRADILALCLSEDEKNLYCAGIDPSIVNYVKIQVKEGTDKWVRSVHRKIHDHDVRSLVLHGTKLYSSGVDGYLACSYHHPKTLLKYPPILQNSCITVCDEARLVLLKYSRHLEVWSLGITSDKRDQHTKLYQLEEGPKKLAVIQKTVKDDDGEDKKEGIICAAISDDGEFILYSTQQGIRLLRLIRNNEEVKLIPLELLNEGGVEPCINAIFTLNNKLIVAPSGGGLQVFKLGTDSPELIQTVNTQTEIEDTITLLAVADSGNYLVAGDVKSNIAVWQIKNDEFKLHCKLPKFNLSPTALAIHPNVHNLVVTYSNNHIIEYDLEKRELTKFSRAFTKNLPRGWTSGTSVIRNITFDARVDHVIIMHDDDGVIIIDKHKKTLRKEDPKVQKTDSQEQNSFKIVKKYKHLVHLSWLSDDEMVAVEVNPLSLIEHLPPCLTLMTFGRK